MFSKFENAQESEDDCYWFDTVYLICVNVMSSFKENEKKHLSLESSNKLLPVNI